MPLRLLLLLSAPRVGMLEIICHVLAAFFVLCLPNLLVYLPARQLAWPATAPASS